MYAEKKAILKSSTVHFWKNKNADIRTGTDYVECGLGKRFQN